MNRSVYALKDEEPLRHMEVLSREDIVVEGIVNIANSSVISHT